jgi:hypothetical protein
LCSIITTYPQDIYKLVKTNVDGTRHVTEVECWNIAGPKPKENFQNLSDEEKFPWLHDTPTNVDDSPVEHCDSRFHKKYVTTDKAHSRNLQRVYRQICADTNLREMAV